MYYYAAEQLFFVIFFARALAQFTTSNLIFHKLCTGYDPDHYLGKICPNDVEAQQETTVLNTWLFVTGNLSFVIACTVGGYYSDFYKRRKPLMYIPLLGLLICSVVNIGFVHFWDEVSGKVVAVFNGVMCLFGETNLLYTGGLCYVTDHSPLSSRSFRIGVFIAAYYVSTPIGRGLAGQLNVQYGFINCYILCIFLYVISLLIVTFCLREAGKAFYADDVEKTSSIKRALTLYDKISIASAAKSEVVVSNRNNAQESNGTNTEKHSHMNNTEVEVRDKFDAVIRVEDLNRIEVANIEGEKFTDHEERDDCEDADLRDNQKKDSSLECDADKNQETNIKIIENKTLPCLEKDTPRAQIVVPTISQNIYFENTSLKDNEWKQAPKSTKLKAKNKRQFYNAYTEGKRPPMTDQKEDESHKKASLLMAFYSLYQSWKVLFRSRTGNRTTILVVMIFTSPLLVAPMIVENSVFPLFVRQKFQWTEPMYGAFAAFKLGVIVVGIIFSIGFLGRVLRVPDAVIGCIASCSDTLACLGYIVVTQSWQMFLVPLCDIFHGSAQIASTAVISKQMDEYERGKLFALKYTMDSLVPVVLYPLYNHVYRETVTYFPAAFFLISAACAVPGIFAFSYVNYLQRDRTYPVATQL